MCIRTLCTFQPRRLDRARGYEPLSGRLDVAAERTSAPRWWATSSSMINQRLAEAGAVQARPTMSLPCLWAGYGAAERASARKLRRRTFHNSGQEIENFSEFAERRNF